MNGLGKPFRKKIRSRKSKKQFSLYFKIRAKNFTRFSLHFLFRRDQNHYSNLTSKIMQMCEQILKKDSAPIQCKFFEL